MQAHTQTPSASTPLNPGAERLPVVRPPVDIFENDQALLLIAELPGATADTLSVQLDRNVLLIEATGSFESGEGELVACEFAQVRYRRAFTLKTDVDGDGIAAVLKDGLLKVTLPRAASSQPRRIAVTEA